MPVRHAKTNTIPAWVQADVDAAIAAGQMPPGTTTANITLSSDWNTDHLIDLSDVIAPGTGISFGGAGTAASPYVINSSAGAAWSITGNAGTVPGTNFLGTTDNQPMVLVINNVEVGRLQAKGTLTLGLGGTGQLRYVNNGTGSYIGLFDNGNTLTYGLASTLGAPIAGFTGFGGWFRGMGLLSNITRTDPSPQPIWGVNTSDQTAGANGRLGNNMGLKSDGTFNSYNNILDSGGTNGYMGLGVNPTSRFHIAGNTSSSAWTINGAGIKIDASTYTDTTSSGTINNSMVAHSLGVPTFAASNATTVQNLATLYLTQPVPGTNITVSNVSTALLINGRQLNTFSSSNAFQLAGTNTIQFDTSSGRMGINAGGGGAKLHIAGNDSQGAWGQLGIGLRFDAATYTDTSTATSGTVAVGAIHAFGTPTIATTNTGINYTEAGTVVVNSGPVGSANIAVNSSYSFWALNSPAKFDAGVYAPDLVAPFTTSVGATNNRFNRLFTNTGAAALVTITLPPITVGARFKFYVQNTNGLRVQAVSSNTIRIAGTVSAASGRADSTTVGSYLTLVAISSTEWVAESSTGVWTLT